MKTLSLTALLFLVLVSQVFAESKSEPAAKEAKPGAPMKLVQDYDGKSALGETERFSISVSTRQPVNQLSVTIDSPDNALTIYSLIELSSSNPPVSSLKLPVELVPARNGQHPLIISAQLVDENGIRQEMKFRITIQTGTDSSRKPDRASEGMIKLPARERIN